MSPAPLWRRIDQALHAVVMEAYVHGVSTRAVDELVQALGIDSGISKSQVSRICAGLDTHVSAFKERRLDHTAFPYVYLDATYLHVRHNHHVVSKAVVIATGVTSEGHREVIGFDVGDSEDEVFWRSFLDELKRRGLSGVRLVISDQHAGLVGALKRCLQGVAHQRCRVHYVEVGIMWSMRYRDAVCADRAAVAAWALNIIITSSLHRDFSSLMSKGGSDGCKTVPGEGRRAARPVRGWVPQRARCAGLSAVRSHRTAPRARACQPVA